MEDEYLGLGLNAMVTAGEPFMAHFGAALLAGWWLDDDARLSEPAVSSMTCQADALMAKHSWLFRDSRRFVASRHPDELIEALDPGLDHTCAIGHDVIYAALVVRTLPDRPELAAGWLIDGVSALLASCREQPLSILAGVFDVTGVKATEVAAEEVATARSVAEVALHTVIEFEHVYLGLHQGEIGHIADHAHALLVLDRLGYKKVAERGLWGFREHLAAARRISRLAADLPEVSHGLDAEPSHPKYWEMASPDNDWAVGHVFKYPYAMLDLLEVAGDEHLKRPVLGRLGQLIVSSLPR